jgi:hypothetical protein
MLTPHTDGWWRRVQFEALSMLWGSHDDDSDAIKREALQACKYQVVFTRKTCTYPDLLF